MVKSGRDDSQYVTLKPERGNSLQFQVDNGSLVLCGSTITAQTSYQRSSPTESDTMSAED